MAITIRIGNKANRKLVTLEMDVRRSLDGDLMIFEHGDIDIVLSSSKNKIIAFPKNKSLIMFMAHRTDYSLF